ncbi:fungal-specific transcription factor domain-containing protein [Plectosphaerella plurivora]|uniref:Fungal-specific transcription factor domain-containing protein n=1 Tax=Plectosphaerella plurivora TaxID=936078 RepID=A0A9P8V107_9PEZI|nr:fungal-specific transcription factor domain-containing protein [Plectosphaerella plurivora]
MPEHSPPSPNTKPPKRQRQSSYDDASPIDAINDASPTSADQNDGPSLGGAGDKASKAAAAAAAAASSTFRNVSACNRCRLRKNRCDQKLPSCASCAKAGVACVGYDPITKKEIPRSYVFYLETRVEQLEALLTQNNIAFPSAEDLETCSRPSQRTARSITDTGLGDRSDSVDGSAPASVANQPIRPDLEKAKKAETASGMLNIVSPSKPRSLASASGVSFNRVVFAAVQYSVSDQNGTQDRNGKGGTTTMRDSFFGLHTKPTIRPAQFPTRDVAGRLIKLYFEHANPQIPILHRGEFMNMFEQAYATQGGPRTSRELYMLNMVFAIGCGVIVGEPVKGDGTGVGGPRDPVDPNKFGQAQPEEYHASAIVHLEACLGTSGGGLEVLQAVLLLANFALLRPVPPGLWYIIGVAVRLAVDLGLHYEDGSDVETAIPEIPMGPEPESKERRESRDSQLRERGRRLYIRDMRRRLWWCTYSFDRLVSTCVGRPFGISDQVITTEFPSLLDDQNITPTGFIDPPVDSMEPSYKHVAYHYFKLRLLQSEIIQVLQYNQTQVARVHGQNMTNSDIHTRLPSPFLVKFDSFRSWRIDIDRRLYQWKNSAPTREETGVAFSTEFLELNYWQAIIMLYRQSLSVPAMFEGEYNTSMEVNSPTAFQAELREDEDRIYLKVAEAGQKILRIYRQLHLSGLVSYTYLSTHHLFMAGISYLYAIWHSPIVRSRLNMDEVDFTILAAKSVFTDLMDKCPPAETCRDAFDRTAKATIKMANSTGGFGSVPSSRKTKESRMDWASNGDGSSTASLHRRRQPPSQNAFQIDMPLSDTLSSPSLSASGELPSGHSPSIARSKTFESDPFTGMGNRGQPSPAGLDPTMMHSPTLMRQNTAPQTASTSANTPYLSQQPTPYRGAGPVNLKSEYADPQMVEFFQTLQNMGQDGNGTAPGSAGGDMGGYSGTSGGGADMSQQQLDLGFGINWDNLHHDFSDGGQQMNIFDGFFFGSQQQPQQQNGNNGSGPNDPGR